MGKSFFTVFALAAGSDWSRGDGQETSLPSPIPVASFYAIFPWWVLYRSGGWVSVLLRFFSVQGVGRIELRLLLGSVLCPPVARGFGGAAWLVFRCFQHE